jgi:drug/metabolite transporter (DMT)-like permease
VTLIASEREDAAPQTREAADPRVQSRAQLRFKTYVSILLIVALNPLGNVLLGAGMKRVGALTSWAPSDLFHFFFRAMTSGTIWLGIGALLMFFVAYMVVLSWADYSYVQPTSSIACFTVALLGHFALHESVAPIRWAGILVVCAGVFIVGHTAPQTTESPECD